MDNYRLKAIKVFFREECKNAYYVDSTSEKCIDINTGVEIPLTRVFDAYLECHYKTFYERKISSFFTGIKSSNKPGNITVPKKIDGKIQSIKLSMVPLDGGDYVFYEMKQDSRIDSVTNLYNRNEFEEDITNLNEEYERTGKISSSLVFIVFDINDLKRKNDELGHPTGDEYIRAAAKCIDTAYNTCGKCYRIGGDEFVVIAYASLASLYRRNDDFERLVSQYKTDIVSELSISYGVATVQENSKLTINQLFKKADNELLRVKDEYHCRPQKTIKSQNE